MTGRLFIALLGMALLVGCSDKIEERDWVTMGTTASVKVKRADSTIAHATKLARELTTEIETLLNVHDPESELSKSAALSDAELVVKFRKLTRSSRLCPELATCFEAAFRLRDQSGGAFNPRWKGDETMDLGGIAKGYAVDVLASQVYAGDGIGQEVLFDIGGNLKCQRGSWTVGIAGTDATLVLKKGEACATSAEYYRGKHIYDGRTGNAVTNDLLSVTIVHPNSAMLADGLSTICFILGETEGKAFLGKFYPEARAIWIKKE